jgi:hypothetical protein
VISPAQILQALEAHSNVLLYGPPGTGKSYLMKEVQNLFQQKYGGSGSNQYVVETGAERSAITTQPAKGAISRWVTFHQGYSYEDFVIGLRPAIGAGGPGASGVFLEPKAGALLDLAALTGNGHGLLWIDEINRGNASRIFGEFITLMEADKRLAEDGSLRSSTVTVSLPYIAAGQTIDIGGGVKVSQQFSMPRNVFTLASMNSVDKSVAPLDAAIRRRFHIINLRPTTEDLASAAGVKEAKSEVAEVAVAVMTSLNKAIGMHLGPEYMLGQYYLPTTMTLGALEQPKAQEQLVDVWRHKLLPQILELLHARPLVCAGVLRIPEKSGKSGVEVIEPNDIEADSGASPFVLNVSSSIDDESIYKYLKSFKSEVKVSEPVAANSTESAGSTGSAGITGSTSA